MTLEPISSSRPRFPCLQHPRAVSSANTEAILLTSLVESPLKGLEGQVSTKEELKNGPTKIVGRTFQVALPRLPVASQALFSETLGLYPNDSLVENDSSIHVSRPKQNCGSTRQSTPSQAFPSVVYFQFNV